MKQLLKQENEMPHTSTTETYGAIENDSLIKDNENTNKVKGNLYQFSLFESDGKGISETVPTRSITLEEYSDMIKIPKNKNIYDTLDSIVVGGDKKLIREAKKKLNYITPSGVFINRKLSQLMGHSGIFHVDIDHYYEDEQGREIIQLNGLDDVKSKIQQLRQDENLNFIIIHKSPTKRGIKAFMKVPIDEGTMNVDHKQIFNAISNYIKTTYDLRIDPNCADITRACFLSYDLDAIWINDNENKVLSDDFINEWSKHEDSANKTTTNNPQIALIRGEIKRKIESCVEQLTTQSIDITANYDDWIKVGFAFAQYGDAGRKYYHQVSAISEKYCKTECDAKYDNFIENYDGRTSIATFFQFCKDRNIYPAEKPKFILESATESLTNIDANELPRMMIGPLLFENEIVVVYGKTNVGKSILGVQIADALTKGQGLFDLVNETEPQKVLYVDAEMSRAKFYKRYSNDSDRREIYPFSHLFLRMFDIHARDRDLIKVICDQIHEHSPSVLIIDNLTKITRGEEKADVASDLLEQLNEIRTDYGITIILLAHTKKIYDCQPMTENDLFGSSKITNLIDSAFAIGKTNRGDNVRYIKQIKSRDSEFQYGANNVMVCTIEKPGNMLRFRLDGIEQESALLCGNDKNRERDLKVIELRNKGKTFSEIEQLTMVPRASAHRVIKQHLTSVQG